MSVSKSEWNLCTSFRDVKEAVLTLTGDGRELF